MIYLLIVTLIIAGPDGNVVRGTVAPYTSAERCEAARVQREAALRDAVPKAGAILTMGCAAVQIPANV